MEYEVINESRRTKLDRECSYATVESPSSRIVRTGGLIAIGDAVS